MQPKERSRLPPGTHVNAVVQVVTFHATKRVGILRCVTPWIKGTASIGLGKLPEPLRSEAQELSRALNHAKGDASVFQERKQALHRCIMGRRFECEIVVKSDDRFSVV